MKLNAFAYNYTRQCAERLLFPLSDEKLAEIKARDEELMVDECDHISVYCMNIDEFQEFVNLINETGMEDLDLRILGKTYLITEIMDALKGADQWTDVYNVVNFSAETASWSSSDVWSESDKGRVLYNGGWALFPAEVPEELEDYMDYAMLWRDAEINMGIRTVTVDGNYYLVWKY